MTQTNINTFNTEAVQIFLQAIHCFDTSNIIGSSLFDLALRYKDWKGAYWAIQRVGSQYPVIELLYNRTFSRVVSKYN